jgi:hypothetical protein
MTTSVVEGTKKSINSFTLHVPTEPIGDWNTTRLHLLRERSAVIRSKGGILVRTLYCSPPRT